MVKITTYFGLGFFLCICFALTILPQNPREILNNAKIVELVRMGLGEALIVAKIKQSMCQCDVSTASLGKLKAAKVSDAIILAMIEAGNGEKGYSETVINVPTHTAKSAEPVTSTKTSTDAGPNALRQITEPGIYLFEDGKMTAIEPSVFSGSKINPLMGSLTMGIKKTKFRAKLRGSAANMQVRSSQPIFYFVFNPEIKNTGVLMAGNLFLGLPATSPAEFMMVQMTVKLASREAVMGEFGAFTGMSMGARDQDIREYAFEKIKSGIYKVMPKIQLTPGEYCFFYAGNVAGMGFAGGKVFDFSVR